MSVVDLAACVQGEGESTTHWVRHVSEILHSSDRINADSGIITLEGNCRFMPLNLKLGRVKRFCNDMGTLMGALVKYADSDSTKDPESDDDEAGKGKKNSNSKGHQYKTEASVRRMAAWTLWLTLMRRTRVSGAEVKRRIVMGLQILTRIA